ncbi:MAG: tetratricopeptide repeat protein [Pseudomonadota bacterium]
MKSKTSKPKGCLPALLALSVGIGASSAYANDDTYASFEPGFLRQAERALVRDDPERALQLVGENLVRDLRTTHRADAHGLACRAHLALENSEGARTSCMDALEIERGRTRWRYLNNLGVAEMRLGNQEAAIKAFEEAVLTSGSARTPRRNLEAAIAAADEGGTSDQAIARRR